VWITKYHGPYEAGLAPPEEVAISPGDVRILGGHVLAVGDTGEVKVKAKIDKDNVAMLRVYNATDINGILAISRGSPDRLDLPLDPGKSDLDVVRVDGQLTLVPHEPGAAASH